ncbi:hypothetical protein [Halopseudomonas salegens]|uniref:Uncharacterized protein n=1 Tax=Halopseudomonas salegens TaxID=1434072 RepID=A0A1H2HE94_9GAMM|nr:hypothetical protein [Halopseudomonas salegens]SDU29888.1 hypothetical protein SAMN05216210_2962 [Halopseudomonas salegens]
MSTQRKFELIDGHWQLVEICQERPTHHTSPRDVTNSLSQYLPFDTANSQRFDALNFLGITLHNIHLKAGDVYVLERRKRIIYEVGCSTIIFMHIDTSSPYNYHFFVQPTQSFLWDVTTGDLAERVVNTAGPMVTLVKYEMYFILGLLSTISIPALLLVVGADFTLTSLSAREKFRASKNLAKAISDEDQGMSRNFPVLREKLREFVISEANQNVERTINALPRTIATDEQTQGTLAGTLFGKATVAPNAFTGWTALLTVLTTAAVKSVTLSPQTYGVELDRRFTPVVDRLINIDWDNPSEVRDVALEVVAMFEDSHVEITQQEAVQIMSEILRNPRAALETLKNLEGAFKAFNREMSGWR